METFDCIVIGGGPAGMMCAATAARSGADVLLLDKNKVLGKKLRITGKGRCNVTNACDRDGFFENIIDNPRFLFGAYASFDTSDTMAFFENLGVPLKTERGNRVFPQSDRADDIADALVSALHASGVKIVTDSCRRILTDDGVVTGVKTANGSIYAGKTVVVATGGCSYAYTGSDGGGYQLASSVGHSVTAIKPFLVPLETFEPDCADMQGLTLKNVSLTLVSESGKVKFTEIGEMLFTHFGVSGPLVLSASCFACPGDKLYLDLKPALDNDTLDRRLLSDFAKYANKNFSNALGDLLPSKMIPVMVARSGIAPETKVNSVTRIQREKLLSLFKRFPLTVKGTRPINEAIVTSGGVSVSEIRPDMSSKIVRGLFFAGEVMDVAAYTGGFNLQIAFSTGHKAGLSVIEYIQGV